MRALFFALRAFARNEGPTPVPRSQGKTVQRNQAAEAALLSADKSLSYRPPHLLSCAVPQPCKDFAS